MALFSLIFCVIKRAMKLPLFFFCAMHVVLIFLILEHLHKARPQSPMKRPLLTLLSRTKPSSTPLTSKIQSKFEMLYGSKLEEISEFQKPRLKRFLAPIYNAKNATATATSVLVILALVSIISLMAKTYFDHKKNLKRSESSTKIVQSSSLPIEGRNNWCHFETTRL